MNQILQSLPWHMPYPLISCNNHAMIYPHATKIMRVVGFDIYEKPIFWVSRLAKAWRFLVVDACGIHII